MYDPKGGNKPAYDPQYQKPPVEEPPKDNPPGDPYGQKPPTDQPPYGQQPPPDKPPYEEPPPDEQPPYGQKPPGNGKTCDPPTGNCKCPDWKLEDGPANEPFRRLLQRLEDILEELAETKPSDATKKFADDLKDAEKEYQAIVALVNKYKEFYDKLDCKMAEAINWREDMVQWIAGKLTQGEQDAIKNSHKTNYDDLETKTCCEWIKCREYFISMQDCFEQSKKKEEEAKDNYDAIKNLEKTLTDRFADLKSLFEKAKGYRDEERFRAVYAVSLEFEDVFQDLSVLRDWFQARTECNIDSDQGQGAQDGGGENDPRKVWTEKKFKAELVRRLRLLILARYQKFRWWHDFLTRTSDNQKKKDACEKFRKERRDKFVQEADDIEPEEGEGEGGGYPGGGGETPKYPGGETPKYPGGETPKYPGGGGETPQYPQTPPQEPPTQQYPGSQYPTKPPQTPPGQQYPGTEQPPTQQQYPGGEQQPPQYQQTPPPPQSRGRQKS